MENVKSQALLLKTAFCCMACDGEIHEDEITLLKNLHDKDALFGNIQITDTLNKLIVELNSNGKLFIQEYLTELERAVLSESEQIEVIRVALGTIQADDKLEYSELKFFKLIRSKIQISDGVILNEFPGIEEYLEKEVSLGKSKHSEFEQFFTNYELPQFNIITEDSNN